MADPAQEDVAHDRTSALQTHEDGVVAISKEVVKEITSDDVPGLAAEVAYYAIFSIPALFVLLISLAAVIDNTANVDVAGRMQEMIDESAPSSTQEILTALVENAVEQADGGTASIGLAASVLVALWAGSIAVGALMKAFNRAYNTNEERSFVKKKALSIVLTILLGLVVNLAIVLWAFGGQIGGWLAREFEMGSAFDLVWNLSRIPVGVFVIVLMLGILYYFGPTSEQEFRWVFPGAAFATIAWGGLIFGFSLYLRVASPGSAYGALGGVIVFLFFLYLSSLIFLVGAEVNAVLARRYDERYQNAIMGDIAEPQFDAAPRLAAPQSSAGASSVGSLALGAVATLGIIVAALLGRRRP